MKTISDNPASSADASPRWSKLRSRIMLAMLLGLTTLAGWEYRAIYNHGRSLSRLQAELTRHQVLGEPLRRTEISRLVQGSPTVVSELRLTDHIDFYTWKGLVHRSHIEVRSDPSEAVQTIENALFGAVGKQPPAPVRETAPARTAPRPPSRQVTARVNTALKQAEQVFRQQGTGSKEFMQFLRSVSQDLPELEVSTVKGQLNWNSFKLSRQKRGLFAFRFSLPATQRPEAYLVSWTNMDSASGILPVRDIPAGTSQEYARWWDQEFDVKIDGVDLPEQNFVQFRWFTGKFDVTNRDYILWFVNDDMQPGLDFEYKALLFSREPERPTPSRAEAVQIADFLGLKTNLRGFEPTDEGLRRALQVVSNRLSQVTETGFVQGVIMPGRILRSVASRLKELPCSDTSGMANWQKLDFPVDRTTAVRVRVPASIAAHADIYGAIASTQEVAVGWDKAGPMYGDFGSSRFQNVQIVDSPIAGPGNLLVFSNIDFVKGIDEFVFWVHRLQPGDDPVYLTLSLLPHNPANDTYESISAHGRPRASAQVAGVTLPPPPAPAGSSILASHERRLTHLMFTPDSERLLSVDILGHTQIWRVADRTFEGQIDIPFNAAKLVLVDPASQTLFAQSDALLRWNLASREPLPKLDILVKGNGDVRAAAFGSLPDELAVIQRIHGSQDEHRHLFGAHSLRDDSAPRLSEPLRESTKSNFYSMIYLPVSHQFAAGRTRDDRSGTIAAFVEIWPADFSKPIRELPLGTHADTGQLHELNPIWISCDPHGRRLAAASERGELKVWDVGSWTELLSTHVEPRPAPPSNTFLPRTPKTFLGVALAPDGESVAAPEQFHDSVTVWNVADGTSQPRWTVEGETMTHVTHSADGAWVATADSTGVVRLWKVDVSQAGASR